MMYNDLDTALALVFGKFLPSELHESACKTLVHLCRDRVIERARINATEFGIGDEEFGELIRALNRTLDRLV